MTLHLHLTAHYDARRTEAGTWQVYAAGDKQPVTGTEHDLLPGAVAEATTLEAERQDTP